MTTVTAATAAAARRHRYGRHRLLYTAIVATDGAAEIGVSQPVGARTVVADVVNIYAFLHNFFSIWPAGLPGNPGRATGILLFLPFVLLLE